MKSAGIISKIMLSSIIVLMVMGMLIGTLFYLGGIVSAPAAPAPPLLDYGASFFAAFLLPVVAASLAGRLLYLAPLWRADLTHPKIASPRPVASAALEKAGRRLYNSPVFAFAWHALVFAAALSAFALAGGRVSGALFPNLALFAAMGLAASVMYSFVQTGLDFRLLTPLYKAFNDLTCDRKDSRVRLGVRFSLNLLFAAVMAFTLLFTLHIIRDLRQAERSQAALLQSVARGEMTAGEAARLAANGDRRPGGEASSDDDPGITALVFILLGAAGLACFLPVTASLRRRILNQRSLLANILCGSDFFQSRINVIERDEIGISSLTINRFIDKFKEILEGIFSGTNTVQTVSGSLDTSLSNASAAIEEMVTTIKQITANTSTQMNVVKNIRGKIEEMLIGIDGTSFDVVELSNFVEETSSAMHQTTANIQTIAKNTEQVNELANRLVEISQSGSISVNDTVSSIREIEKAFAKVGNIVGIISEIASQTNLLSLNASIEAAHAGDKGKGFAVVATEIRKLAEQSNENIELIGKQIENMTEKVKTGVALTTSADEAFRKIYDDIKLTTQHINQVTIALQEQNQGTREIMTALEEMVKKTVEVKEIAEDLKHKSEEIHKFMEELYNISVYITEATGEQDKGNKEILALITAVKNASRQNLSVVDSLHTIVNDYQAKRAKKTEAAVLGAAAG